MAIYRFRVSFEDYDDIFREIDVLSTHTFLDLHLAIHQSTGYQTEVPSSFYVSNDHWKKGDEIAYLPNDRKIEHGVIRMDVSKLNKFIDDPHQKFYYIYNFEKPFDFHVQLIKILKEEEGKLYPAVFKSVGKAPRPLGVPVKMDEIDEKKDEDEDDFLEEPTYGIDESEDFGMLDEDETDSAEEDNTESGFEDEF